MPSNNMINSIIFGVGVFVTIIGLSFLFDAVQMLSDWLFN